jgi:hypothetical protein
VSVLRHGKLSIDVPGDWLDQSTLLFVQPREGAEAVPAPAVTPTLSVRFAFGPGLVAREIVDAEVEKMTVLQPRLQRVSAGDFEGALGKGFMQHVRTSLMDAPIEQLAAAWVVGDIGVLACVACGGRELARERSRLEAMLRAITLS